MEIGVRVEAQPWGNAADEPVHVASAYFVFVAIDEEGHPRPVPPLETETPTATYAGGARPRSGAPTGWRARPRSSGAAKDERGVSDWRHVRTTRLRLDEPVDADAADLFAIHSDPASWAHFPSGPGDRPGGGTGHGRCQPATVRPRRAGVLVGARRGRRPGRGPRRRVRAAGRGAGRRSHGTRLVEPLLPLRPAGRSAAATPPRWGGGARGGPGRRPRSGPCWPTSSSTTTPPAGRPRASACAWSGAGPTPTTPIREAVRLVYLDRDPDDELMAALAGEGMGQAGARRLTGSPRRVADGWGGCDW